MTRLERKCLLASLGMHAILLLLVVFGTAFIQPSAKRPPSVARLKVVPTMLIDQALSGGGGNPNLPPSDAQQKGNTLKPVPTQPPAATPPPQTPPRVVAPPKAETRQPVLPPAKSATRPTKPETVPKSTSKDTGVIPLKPVVRNSADREAARAEAESRAIAAANQRASRQIGKALENLRAGFEQGTVVEASGPGGAAYISYAAWVKQVYEDAWIVSDSLIDDDGTVRVVVTISRSGNVISAYIDRRSGNTPLDRSVQRTLDRVKFVAPFPEGAKEDQRNFTINFNLKAKRGTG